MKLREYITNTELAQELKSNYEAITSQSETDETYLKVANLIIQKMHRLMRLDVDNNDIADADTKEQLYEIICHQVERIMNAWHNVQDLINLDNGKTHSQKSVMGWRNVSADTATPIPQDENTNWNDYDVIAKQNQLLDTALKDIMGDIYSELSAFVWN